MSNPFLPLAVAHWTTNDIPPKLGQWNTHYFDSSEYMEAWDLYMRRKFEGYAVYLTFKGHVQAEANIGYLPPVVEEDDTLYDSEDVA